MRLQCGEGASEEYPMSIRYWSVVVAVALVAATDGFALHAAVALEVPQADTRVFELRTYKAAPGKMQDVEARFRDHTLTFFAKHGLQPIGGYYIPTEGEDANNAIVYILVHESRAAADQNWAAFGADAEWQQVRTASMANGPITTSVTRQWLRPADWSPVR
jgi:hypothetical protein